MFLVIGYGNLLRQDDGVGLGVVDFLNDLPECVVRMTAHQLTVEISETLSAADGVVFVDASVEGEPGEVRCEDVELPASVPDSFTHDVTPSLLLAYANRLYGRSPPAILISVVGERFGVGEGLSASVKEALPEAASRAARWIEARLGKAPSGAA